MLSPLCEGPLGFGVNGREAPTVVLILSQAMMFSLD